MARNARGPSAFSRTISNSPGTFPLINSAPYYNQPTYYGQGDGVVLGYRRGHNGEHNQFYGTYFGGDFANGGTIDQVTTMAWKGDQLYIAGIIAKGQDVTSFFPLVNPGLPAYFDGTYQFIPDQLGLNQNISDAFVASICTDVVGIDEVTGDAISTFVIGGSDGHGRTLFGLPDGKVQLQVFDATGRLVSTEITVSIAGRARMLAQEQAAGLYLVQAVAQGYRGWSRFVSPR